MYDPQVGLQENYFRDYDPAVDRYVESDPIGVERDQWPSVVSRAADY